MIFLRERTACMAWASWVKESLRFLWKSKNTRSSEKQRGKKITLNTQDGLCTYYLKKEKRFKLAYQYVMRVSDI